MRALHAGSHKQTHLRRYRWLSGKTESNRGEDHGSLLLDYRNEVTVEVSQVSMQGLKSPGDHSSAFSSGKAISCGPALTGLWALVPYLPETESATFRMGTAYAWAHPKDEDGATN
jgi:hypothetical protein